MLIWVALACRVDDGAPSVPEDVAIPGGAFAMGSDTGEADEAPVHTVSLSPFRISTTEVTQAQWAACVSDGPCATAGVAGDDDVPVTGIAKTAAAEYCAWRDGRLPTEAEWERAARGTDARTYPWGDDAPDCDRAATRACGDALVPVGSHPDGASPEGVLDLAGNAWEFVADVYDARWYATSPEQDPTGPDAVGLDTLRGVDSWADASALRASNRELAIPDAWSARVGFRCAWEDG